MGSGSFSSTLSQVNGGGLGNAFGSISIIQATPPLSLYFMSIEIQERAVRDQRFDVLRVLAPASWSNGKNMRERGRNSNQVRIKELERTQSLCKLSELPSALSSSATSVLSVSSGWATIPPPVGGCTSY